MIGFDAPEISTMNPQTWWANGHPLARKVWGLRLASGLSVPLALIENEALSAIISWEPGDSFMMTRGMAMEAAHSMGAATILTTEDGLKPLLRQRIAGIGISAVVAGTTRVVNVIPPRIRIPDLADLTALLDATRLQALADGLNTVPSPVAVLAAARLRHGVWATRARLVQSIADMGLATPAVGEAQRNQQGEKCP